jgi:hypothetical protein
MHLIRWTASPNLSMSRCTSISNGQLIMWWSARHGLRETGPLMLVQFQRGMPTSALILYLISITRYTLNTPHRKIGGALFRIGAHMMPGASALLSLIRRSLQTMRTTTNYPPEITLLHLNILPLPLSLFPTQRKENAHPPPPPPPPHPSPPRSKEVPSRPRHNTRAGSV